MSGEFDGVLSSVTAFGRRYRRHLGALALCATLGVSAATLNSMSESEQTQLGDNWVLPVDPETAMISSVDTMLAEPFFGGPPVIVEPPEQIESDGPNLDDWHLLGIIFEGNRQSIVIMNEASEELQHAQVGDTLPGGELLIEILDNAIEIQSGNENKSIALFRDVEK